MARGGNSHGHGYVLVAALFVCVGLSGEPTRITFLHPRSVYVTANPMGTDIPVSTHIAPDARNRLWRLTWDGDGCAYGRSQRPLDGENAPSVQPETLGQKLYTVRVYEGTCIFLAETFGPDATVIERGQMKVEAR